MKDFNLKKYLAEGRLLKEELQTELFGFGKHDLEKEKINKDGFTITGGGNNGFMIKSNAVGSVTMGPFELDGNGNLDTSDKNTRKLLKKANGFDGDTRAMIRIALQDSRGDYRRIIHKF